MRILIVICCLLVHVSYAQTYNELISDSLYNKFLLDITIAKGSKYHFNTQFSNRRMLKWDTLEFSDDSMDFLEKLELIGYLLKNKPFDTLFTQLDIDYFKRQIHVQKDSLWRLPIKTTKFISNQRTDIPYNSYSLPLFSSDMKLAIIKRKYFCSSSNPCLQIVCDVYRQIGKQWCFFEHLFYVTD